MVNVVTTGFIVSRVLIQVFRLLVYPVLHEDKVQVPYVDQAPFVQVLDWVPSPFEMVHDEVEEPEQIDGTHKLPESA